MNISIYIAVSANGFISNSRNAPDWLSSEYSQGLYARCQKAGAVIMGRTTYTILAPDYLPLKTEGTTVVLTTDESATSDNPTVIFTKNSAPEIAELLQKKGHTEAVLIGGAMAMSEFIKADLVDELYFVMEPVLFGSGLPLLKNVELESKLKLIEVTKLSENTIQLHYQLQKPS